MESRKLTEKQTNVILMNQPVRFWSWKSEQTWRYELQEKKWLSHIKQRERKKEAERNERKRESVLPLLSLSPSLFPFANFYYNAS